ncbi:MAG: hypothetical protein RL033_5494, partial [Pseudomonadota bacterium]
MVRFRARELSKAHVASSFSLVLLFSWSSSEAEKLPAPPSNPFAAVGSVENSGGDCTIPVLPTFDQLPEIEALPDP